MTTVLPRARRISQLGGRQHGGQSHVRWMPAYFVAGRRLTPHFRPSRARHTAQPAHVAQQLQRGVMPRLLLAGAPPPLALTLAVAALRASRSDGSAASDALQRSRFSAPSATRPWKSTRSSSHRPEVRRPMSRVRARHSAQHASPRAAAIAYRPKLARRGPGDNRDASTPARQNVRCTTTRRREGQADRRPRTGANTAPEAG